MEAMEFIAKEMDKTEELIIVKPCIVREAGADKGRHCKYGDPVSVKGTDKAELIVRNFVVTKAEFAAIEKEKKQK
jgi:hypothetical protein